MIAEPPIAIQQRAALREIAADVPLFEVKPRWPGAPKICTAANLFAFPAQKDLDAFRTRYGSMHAINKVWLCGTCLHLHHEVELK